ncbi:MAG: type IV pili twitching motility protein PilT, partial [bacterium]|nr:type IV pili twitching motility protein PilT [bacterium]
MDVRGLLKKTVSEGASDLHLTVGSPPVLRVNGLLKPLTEFSPLLPQETEEMIFSVITPEQKEIFLQTKELD